MLARERLLVKLKTVYDFLNQDKRYLNTSSLEKLYYTNTTYSMAENIIDQNQNPLTTSEGTLSPAEYLPKTETNNLGQVTRGLTEIVEKSKEAISETEINEVPLTQPIGTYTPSSAPLSPIAQEANTILSRFGLGTQQKETVAAQAVAGEGVNNSATTLANPNQISFTGVLSPKEKTLAELVQKLLANNNKVVSENNTLTIQNGSLTEQIGKNAIEVAEHLKKDKEKDAKNLAYISHTTNEKDGKINSFQSLSLQQDERIHSIEDKLAREKAENSAKDEEIAKLKSQLAENDTFLSTVSSNPYFGQGIVTETKGEDVIPVTTSNNIQQTLKNTTSEKAEISELQKELLEAGTALFEGLSHNATIGEASSNLNTAYDELFSHIEEGDIPNDYPRKESEQESSNEVIAVEKITEEITLAPLESSASVTEPEITKETVVTPTQNGTSPAVVEIEAVSNTETTPSPTLSESIPEKVEKKETGNVITPQIVRDLFASTAVVTMDDYFSTPYGFGSSGAEKRDLGQFPPQLIKALDTKDYTELITRALFDKYSLTKTSAIYLSNGSYTGTTEDRVALSAFIRALLSFFLPNHIATIPEAEISAILSNSTLSLLWSTTCQLYNEEKGATAESPTTGILEALGLTEANLLAKKETLEEVRNIVYTRFLQQVLSDTEETPLLEALRKAFQMDEKMKTEEGKTDHYVYQFLMIALKNFLLHKDQKGSILTIFEDAKKVVIDELKAPTEEEVKPSTTV